MKPAEMKIRLPQDLRDWLENRSIRNFRPMNGEVVAILSAIRAGEASGSGFEKLANPSGIPGTVNLFSE